MKRFLRIIVALLIILLVLTKQDYIYLTIDFSLEGVEYMILGYLILAIVFDLLNLRYRKYVFLDMVILSHLLFKLAIGVTNAIRGNINYNLSYIFLILFATILYVPIIYIAYKEKALEWNNFHC